MIFPGFPNSGAPWRVSHCAPGSAWHEMTELAQLHHQTWLLELPRPENPWEKNRDILKEQREFMGDFHGIIVFLGKTISGWWFQSTPPKNI
jgi:hypothetical protein